MIALPPRADGEITRLATSRDGRVLVVTRGEEAEHLVLVDGIVRWRLVDEGFGGGLPWQVLPAPVGGRFLVYVGGESPGWRLGDREIVGFDGGAWSADGTWFGGPGGAWTADGVRRAPALPRAQGTDPALWCAGPGGLWFVRDTHRWSWSAAADALLEDAFRLPIADRRLDRPDSSPIVWSPDATRLLWQDLRGDLWLADPYAGTESRQPPSTAWGWYRGAPAGYGPEGWWGSASHTRVDGSAAAIGADCLYVADGDHLVVA